MRQALIHLEQFLWQGLYQARTSGGCIYVSKMVVHVYVIWGKAERSLSLLLVVVRSQVLVVTAAVVVLVVGEENHPKMMSLY